MGGYIIFTYFRGCLDNRMSDILSIEINQSTAKKIQTLISLEN